MRRTAEADGATIGARRAGRLLVRTGRAVRRRVTAVLAVVLLLGGAVSVGAVVVAATGQSPAGTSVGPAVSMPWKLLSLSPDRRMARIRFVSGDGWCYSHVRTDVLERDGRLQMIAVSAKRYSQACPSVVRFGTARVTLPRPLGATERLQHYPVDAAWDNPAYLE